MLKAQHTTAFLATLILVLGLSQMAQAHRVNIFAWVEGSVVMTESGFSNGNKVQQGEVTVFDARSGEVLLQGRTDTKGRFSFPLPQAGREHGLRIRIDAGSGHRNEWHMEPDELSGPAGSAAPEVKILDQEEAGAASLPGTTNMSQTMKAEDIRAVLEQTLEAKLGPLRRDLAALRTHEPGIAEIVGGMGWLVGLAGMAMYCKARRRG